VGTAFHDVVAPEGVGIHPGGIERLHDMPALGLDCGAAAEDRRDRQLVAEVVAVAHKQT
jgi:hypothetical protein